MTVRVGFLGGGFIAHYHGKMLHTSQADVAIVAVHDPDPVKAQEFADRSGATIYGSEDEVIAAVDAVYVTTWTAEHRRLVEKVADAGLPVFCEKPLAFSGVDAAAMVDSVAAAGVINQVGLVLRDSPACLYLRHLIGRPESGRLMSIVFRDDQFIPIQGMYGSSWRADPTKAGAGTLLEHSIHDLDLLEWMVGPVASVSGRTETFHDLAGIEDVTVATLAYAGGGLASLTSVWHDVLSRPSLRRIEVFCERAHYVLEGDVLGPIRWTLDGVTGADGVVTADEGMVEGDALIAVLADAGIEVRNPDGAFIESIIAGTPASPDFAAALRAHTLVDAIYASAQAEMPGTPVATV